MRKASLSLALVAAIAATGCATSNPGNLPVYSSNSVGYTSQGTTVTITKVEDILIEMEQGNRTFAQALAAGAGGLVGYALGNSVGNGSGKEVARTVGGVAGAAGGAAVANQKEMRPGWRIEFKYLENGRWVTGAVKQFKGGPVPNPGQQATWNRGGNAGDRITTL
jgi:outer membrane lipoprotein SlyB